MAELTLTSNTFDTEVLGAKEPVLVDFFATWCGPCSMIAPHITALAEEYPSLKVCRVDVDAAGDLAMRYGVQSIPTLLFFRDGKVVNTLVGYRSPAELKKAVEALL